MGVCYSEGRADRDSGSSSCRAGWGSAVGWGITWLMPWLNPSASLHPGAVPCPCRVWPGSLQSHSSACLHPFHDLAFPSVMQKAAKLHSSLTLWVDTEFFQLAENSDVLLITSLRGTLWGSSPSGKEWHRNTCDVKSQKVLPDMTEQC